MRFCSGTVIPRKSSVPTLGPTWVFRSLELKLELLKVPAKVPAELRLLSIGTTKSVLNYS